jgi:hypothetical protein
MAPLTFLTAMLGLTLATFVGHVLSRRRATRRLRLAAIEWRMHYAEEDRFQITPRVAERFPVPGASDFAIFDLLYRQDKENYRYLFTVEYTQGVVRAKRRVRRVGLLSEPRDSYGAEAWSALTLAREDLPVIEQYRSLRGVLGDRVEEKAN